MSTDYDNFINIINENKEFIKNSVIFVPFNASQELHSHGFDFFENIVSVLTDTVIFGKDRVSEVALLQPISKNLLTNSVCIFFIEPYNKYNIDNFSEWFKDLFKDNFNFESYKILDSANYKLEIKNPSYSLSTKEPVIQQKEGSSNEELIELMNKHKSRFFRIIERDWMHLLDGEDFLYHLNNEF